PLVLTVFRPGIAPTEKSLAVLPTVTLSNTAVVTLAPFDELTARPIYAAGPRANCKADPTWFHVMPFVDANAVIVLPCRTSFSQYGTPIVHPHLYAVPPFAPPLPWKSTAPPTESRPSIASLDPAARPSRISPPTWSFAY